MAALLSIVKVARSVRDRARAVADMLPRGIADPLRRPEQEVAAFLENLGLSGPATPRQADAMLTLMYEQLEVVEARLKNRGLANVLQRRAVGALREAVIDLELLLVPERERDFALLGASRTDSVAAVKSKFRALARRHHPDVAGGDAKRMEELNRAYKVVLRMRGAHAAR